jgi:hypothetical protein
MFVLSASLIVVHNTAYAAVQMPHNQNASGRPYFGGTILNNNYTYYVTERDTAMNRWHFFTGRRYIDAWTTGKVMTQYVVYSGSQQDLDLATIFNANSCKYWTDYSADYRNVRAFMFGHQLHNNDRYYTVICLNVSALGYPVPYDGVNQETRIKGMTHEMGHSLHLDHPLHNGGAMDKCWCYHINSLEVDVVNWTYAAAP